MPPEPLAALLPLFRRHFPGVEAGVGTDANFAELNRNRPAAGAADFIAFPVSPQVHESDTRSLIENLAAQSHALQTAATFAGNRQIRVSPVTLKPCRDAANGQAAKSLPDADARQVSLFAAAWTLLSLKSLAAAASVTFYETVGLKGIVCGDAPGFLPAVRVFPVYLVLRQLHAFRATHLCGTQSSQPLQLDGAAFENAAGERLLVLVNFTDKTLKAGFPVAHFRAIRTKKLTLRNIGTFLENPEKFPRRWKRENAAQPEFVVLLPKQSLSFVRFSA